MVEIFSENVCMCNLYFSILFSVKNIIVNQEPTHIHEVSLLKVAKFCYILTLSSTETLDIIFSKRKKKKKRGENLSQVPYVKMHEVSIGSSEFM